MSSSLANFQNYANNILHNKIPQSEIFNGYTTFLMRNHNRNHNYRQNIRQYRMNWIINNFISYDGNGNGNDNVHEDYKTYYHNNIQDSYTSQFNPPSCFYNYLLRIDDMEREIIMKELEERYNDDIETHYRDIAAKYDRSNQVVDTTYDDEMDELLLNDENDKGYFTQSDIIDDYNDDDYSDFDTYDNYNDYYDENDNDEDYNDW